MNSDIKLLLAEKLRKLRKKYGYTQQQLSKLAGVDYKHIQLLESKKPPAVRIDTLQKIAKAFNMTCSELLDFLN